MKERKSVKIMLSIMVALMLFSSLFTFAGCTHKAKYYTVEEHAQRIRERMEKRMEEKPSYSSFTGFEVYPLYNANDELNYFLIEFEPHGFTFVMVRDQHWIVESWTSMYLRANCEYEKETWTPYTIYEKPGSDPIKIWKVDSNNNKVCYDRSPYYVTDNLNEKKYLLHADGGGYTCAIKNGEKFINLVSMTEFGLINGEVPDNQAILFIMFIPKESFEL